MILLHCLEKKKIIIENNSYLNATYPDTVNVIANDYSNDKYQTVCQPTLTIKPVYYIRQVTEGLQLTKLTQAYLWPTKQLNCETHNRYARVVSNK